jgi:chromosome segregation ATPase
MIESIMYFGLGFLAAALMALVIVPFVHARAVRLTIRRLEAATPLSMAEIQADKDQLRAEFAMSTRRLEMSVEQLKTKTTGQLAELGKKTDAINRLKIELGEKSATIFALEARDKALRDQLRTTEEELTVKTNALREAERSLADRQSDLSKLTTGFDEKSVVSASLQIEIMSLKTQVDNLTDQIAGLKKEVADAEGRLVTERANVETATRQLADERGQVVNLGKRIAQLEAQIAQQSAEAEVLNRRVSELQARATEQARVAAERERERDQLRLQVEAARRVEADLRGELASLDRRHAAATETLRMEKSIAESQVERARDDRSKAHQDLAALQREAEETWQAERVENALLRERINDVAAEVARLTAALEGPGSPIETILAEASAPRLQAAMNGAPGSEAGATITNIEDAKGSLADRIRALQTRASRVSSAT